MNNELKHLQHPANIRIFWLAIYMSAFLLFSSWAYASADQIKAHVLPSGEVQLAIPYSKYVVGESINFEIKNNYNSTIYVVNNCPGEPLAVYRQENGKWMRLQKQISEDTCPFEERLVNVQPGDSVHGNFNAWQSLFDQPGKYRIVAFVEYYNALPYQDIEILPKPESVVVPVNRTVPSSRSTRTPNTPTPPSATTDKEPDITTPQQTREHGDGDQSDD